MSSNDRDRNLESIANDFAKLTVSRLWCGLWRYVDVADADKFKEYLTSKIATDLRELFTGAFFPDSPWASQRNDEENCITRIESIELDGGRHDGCLVGAAPPEYIVWLSQNSHSFVAQQLRWYITTDRFLERFVDEVGMYRCPKGPKDST